MSGTMIRFSRSVWDESSFVWLGRGASLRGEGAGVRGGAAEPDSSAHPASKLAAASAAEHPFQLHRTGHVTIAAPSRRPFAVRRTVSGAPVLSRLT
jgi:hypothetical protein